MALAPTRTFARPILGTVGDATAEIVKSSGGTVGAGDKAGISGLEKRYDTQLRGVAGLQVRLVGPAAAAAVLYTTPAVPGKPLTTTLEAAAQALADRLLAPIGPGSALVAIRPSTGDVVAAASGPGTRGFSAATVGHYPPGSTFKIATTLALLRAGRTPSSPLPCTPTIVVNGKSFKNYSDYPAGGLGSIPLRTALANSCNTAFLAQAAAIPQRGLVAAAASLGLGVDHDLGLPAFLGSVPASATAVEHAASMIGQAKVEASPLSMAALVASVVKGSTVVPRVIAGASQAPPAGTSPAPPLTAGEAQLLRQLMMGVVRNGSGRVLAGLPGPPIGAKTGTAEYGAATPRRTHGWMIAFQGDLAVAVFVEDAVSGSKTAGPILEAFLRGMARP